MVKGLNILQVVKKLKVPASTIRKMICGKMFPHLDREGVKDIASINIKNNKNYKN